MTFQEWLAWVYSKGLELDEHYEKLARENFVLLPKDTTNNRDWKPLLLVTPKENK